MADFVGLAEAVRGLVEDGQDGWTLHVAADLR
jgi:hypothetical protein